ncbi:unnamed protein product [Ostreobium quekettii]|uniref:Uncharacterized protein n=1 Tax=Ostreobium quekettii TaxID=121088 RepID=A0A8S1IQB2_9CHLO|nr:unnamed protein product [Ostreobium quekettii]
MFSFWLQRSATIVGREDHKLFQIEGELAATEGQLQYLCGGLMSLKRSCRSSGLAAQLSDTACFAQYDTVYRPLLCPSCSPTCPAFFPHIQHCDEQHLYHVLLRKHGFRIPSSTGASPCLKKWKAGGLSMWPSFTVGNALAPPQMLPVP